MGSYAEFKEDLHNSCGMNAMEAELDMLARAGLEVVAVIRIGPAVLASCGLYATSP